MADSRIAQPGVGRGNYDRNGARPAIPIPPWEDLLDTAFHEENVYNYLVHRNVITIPVVCPNCPNGYQPGNLTRTKKNRKKARCTKTKSTRHPSCGRKSVSFLKGTFSGKTQLAPHQVMKIAYEWALLSVRCFHIWGNIYFF